MELEPSNLAIRLECALVYGNLGRWDRALPHLSKAGELERADANLGFWWFHLAIAHWHVGEKEEARDWYGQALTWMVKNQPRNAKLRRVRDQNLANLQAVIAGQTAFSAEFCTRYYTEHLRFTFDDQEKAGLRRFGQACAKLGLIRAGIPDFQVV